MCQRAPHRSVEYGSTPVYICKYKQLLPVTVHIYILNTHNNNHVSIFFCASPFLRPRHARRPPTCPSLRPVPARARVTYVLPPDRACGGGGGRGAGRRLARGTHPPGHGSAPARSVVAPPPCRHSLAHRAPAKHTRARRSPRALTF